MSGKKEVNGNNNYVQSGKRKTNKKTSSTPSNKPFDNMPSYQFCPTNHRMFPTMSDSSLCYPYMNCSLSVDPITSFSIQQPYSYPNHNFGMFNSPFMNYCKSQESDFTSLPYVNNDLSDSENKRRLSDPGISNESDINDSANADQVVRSLVEQVHYLKDSNRRLYRELQEMRNEMNFLRQQCSARYYDKEYEPGMLSDVIREIRDAARIREEALLSRVKHMIEERQLAMVSFLKSFNILKIWYLLL